MPTALVVVGVLLFACASPARSPTATARPTTTARPTSRPAQPTPTVAPSLHPTRTGTPAADRQPTGPTQSARVVSISDGDTIRVEFGGNEYALRYIGIDTPETGGPYVPIEPFGHEAARANRELVEGRTVTLEMDVSDTDRFGRLLRHVWLSNADGWLLVSAELVRQGMATVTTFPPDVKYVDVLLDAQHDAQDAGRGVWGEAAVTPPPAASSLLPLVGGLCESSYPEQCIARSPPDLDCADIPYRRFTVRPPDPHRFDGNGDRVGCESD